MLRSRASDPHTPARTGAHTTPSRVAGPPGPAAGTALPCDLSTSSGGTSFCGGVWTTAGGDFPWSYKRSGGTTSSSTGPSSGPNGLPYLFVEASSPNYPSKTSYLVSRSGLYRGLTFQYHMYGSNIGSLAVEVQAVAGGAWVEQWRLSGAQQSSHASAWVGVAVAFQTPAVHVRFTSVTGSSYRGDTAVAELVLFSPQSSAPEGMVPCLSPSLLLVLGWQSASRFRFPEI